MNIMHCRPFRCSYLQYVWYLSLRRLTISKLSQDLKSLFLTLFRISFKGLQVLETLLSTLLPTTKMTQLCSYNIFWKILRLYCYQPNMKDHWPSAFIRTQTGEVKQENFPLNAYPSLLCMPCWARKTLVYHAMCFCLCSVFQWLWSSILYTAIKVVADGTVERRLSEVQYLNARFVPPCPIFQWPHAINVLCYRHANVVTKWRGVDFSDLLTLISVSKDYKEGLQQW